MQEGVRLVHQATERFIDEGDHSRGEDFRRKFGTYSVNPTRPHERRSWGISCAVVGFG
jgi:hypothetical protein